MTPHIYTDTEARALLGKTGHTSWSCEPTREVMSLAVSRVLCDGRLIAEVVSEHASLVAAAPDLAATVVVLHGQIDEMRAVIYTLETLLKEDVAEAKAMEKIKAGTLLRAFAHKMLTEGNPIERLLPLVTCAEKIERGDEGVGP